MKLNREIKCFISDLDLEKKSSKLEDNTFSRIYGYFLTFRSYRHNIKIRSNVYDATMHIMKENFQKFHK